MTNSGISTSPYAAKPVAAGEAPSTPQPLALYVHIPFCETKCPYCDFNTYAAIEPLMPAYVEALTHEIMQWCALLERPELGSLFFGGGTPSYLPTRDLTKLMVTIRKAFQLREDAEATLEANPGDITRERAKAMRRAGFNRISIGVQSMDNSELKLLGRRHSAEQAERAIVAVRQAGFSNVSIDLIFGLPYQFVTSWEHGLEAALALRPDHLSLYALTLEPGTPMEAEVRQGRLPEPNPDVAAEMYRHAQRVLAEAGYQQYEISNWARPGYASRHNLVYWHSGPYLGVGPGAHSYLVSNGQPALEWAGPWGTRFAVVPSPRTYIGKARLWRAVADAGTLGRAEDVPFLEQAQVLDAATAMAETMMMGLRTNEGVSSPGFQARFGRSIVDQFPGAVSECIELGLLEWADDHLRLTDGARLLGNEVFRRFLTPQAG